MKEPTNVYETAIAFWFSAGRLLLSTALFLTGPIWIPVYLVIKIKIRMRFQKEEQARAEVKAQQQAEETDELSAD